MTKSFRDLLVWQKAVQLSKQIYLITAAFPDSEKFGLTNQIRRAAVSVASNIAEGSGRFSDKEFIHFLTIARGSLNEVFTQLIIAKEIGFLEEAKFAEVETQINELGKMLNGLRKSMVMKEKKV